jgi:hypothetical protein
MPYLPVSIGTNTSYTSANGNFNIINFGATDVTVKTSLLGTWFHVFNYTGADLEDSIVVTPPGPANFVFNAANNTESVLSQVNAYVLANKQRQWVLQQNGAYPEMAKQGFPIYCNRTDGYCPGNAWYDPGDTSMNFCSSGSGHPNTAWSSVLHHEFGHHLINVSGSGQGHLARAE